MTARILAIAVAAVAVTFSSAVAHAEPTPPPLPWEDQARALVADAVADAGYDPAQAQQVAQRILGQYLP